MAYFNDYNNAGFYYPTSSAPAFEGVDAYPFLRRTPATEEVNFPVHHALDDRWGMARRPEPMIGSPTSYSNPHYNFLVDRCPTRGSPEPAATSYATQASCYSQPFYSGHYWPGVGQQTQPYPSGFFSRDDPFTSTTALEASTIGPALSDVPLDYWGADKSEAPTSTFYAAIVRARPSLPNPVDAIPQQNDHPSYQPSTGPTRTGLVSTGRFQPYGVSRAHPCEHRNADAGPSTIVPPLIPYIDLPIQQSSGGMSETTADAEQTQTFTEEDKIPRQTPKRIRCPSGQGIPRRHRKRSQKDAAVLCGLIQRRKGDRELPSLNKALADALEIIPTFRPIVNPEPCLLTKEGERIEPGSKGATEERKRRDEERRLLKEFSQYYPLEQGKELWERPKLLLQVLKDVEDLPVLPEKPNESPPLTSAAKAAVSET